MGNRRQVLGGAAAVGPGLRGARGWVLVALGALAAGCSEDDVPGGKVRDLAFVPDAAPVDQGGNCTPRPETCNGQDDDCDGLVDDADPDLQSQLFSDPENCGRCGVVCAAPEATTACAEGRCFITACTPGFTDANGRPDDGCESDCLITAGGREVCDAIDNDCDGEVDEDFDLDTDPLHCGACGEACPTVADAVVGCAGAACVVTECARDRYDLDGEVENGCEYTCSPGATDRVREFCNGRDDDCDGAIDEAADLAPPPADLCGVTGVCAGECGAALPCAGDDVCREGVCLPAAADAAPTGAPCAADADCVAVHPGFACVGGSSLVDGQPTTVRTCRPRTTEAVCDAEAGWRCARSQRFQRGDEVGLCDGLDNDCDGRTDEDFAAALLDEGGRPRTCEAGAGACRQVAPVRCADDGASTFCPAEATPPPTALDTTCDERDDDCDGAVDEDFVQAWVSLGAFEIFAYEASRPGADAQTPGIDISPDPGRVQYREGKACAVAGVLPWANVAHAEAVAACAAAGGRLCSDAEWSRACGTAANLNFPYGNVFQPLSCNGGAFDADPRTAGVQNGVVVTGGAPLCVAGGVYDLSGNLKEWTSDLRDGLRPVRGGGFESNVAEGLTCGQRGDLKPDALRSSSLGFRCCRNAAP